ncbi:hypothetical protein M011DRAFT_527419 [Sporormia fimetaria CBS 119925]|uniref:Uncharacterized protein n=1 Tax=Sporormia fimetaria CBS 119925 TaxID=1340428 RepID=A0A6A6V7Q6_9PLEO|nr:hypothetical protein M011DRAFT_527419 [Sporormia fimetaria CBS 119925]
MAKSDDAGKKGDIVGQGARKQIREAAEEARKRVNAVAQNASKNIISTAEQAKDWIIENPKKAAVIGGCLVAPPIAGTIIGPALGFVGFGPGGVAAGSAAAVWQARIGNVVAPSVFSFLQSAAAGGAGATVVNGTAVGVTSLAGAGVAAKQLCGGVKKDEQDGNGADEDVSAELEKTKPEKTETLDRPAGKKPVIKAKL